MIIQDLVRHNVIHPPKWLEDNTHLLVRIGGKMYGYSDESGDNDLYGVCIPPKEQVFPAGEIIGFGRQIQRFEQWQQHGITWNAEEYDFTVYSIVKFFNLCMENNPNFITVLYVPQNHVLHITSIGNIIRENRKIFLHKGLWHKYKGYSYSQIHKMRTKLPDKDSKRHKYIEQFGYDCYLEKKTEFLTQIGWKKFDDVKNNDLLGTVDIKTGKIIFEKQLKKIDKKYSGEIYTVSPYLNRFSITKNHNILVSDGHRNSANNYSSKYNELNSNWRLMPLNDVLSGKNKRSHYFIRRGGECHLKDYEIDDDYLKLSGLYISEGCINFRKEKVKCARITQSKKGNKIVFKIMDILSKKYKILKYDYKKETIWTIEKNIAKKLYEDFGHGSRNKKLPKWCFKLSNRQAKILWDHLCYGDGTITPNGNAYYSINKKLSDDIQAMMTISGFICSVRGPYKYKISFTNQFITSYQTYVPNEQNKFWLVDFRSKEYTIKKRIVKNKRVVCFTVSNGTLITRNDGKIGIQGNCKFGLHCVRLLLEAEQILAEGDLDVLRHKEVLKSIKRGEWPEQKVYDWFEEKEKQMESLYEKSTLPWGPDEDSIKTLLLKCLEMHYGSLDKSIVIEGQEKQILRQIKELCEKVV